MERIESGGIGPSGPSDYRWVQRAAVVAIGALLLGAGYLIAVRGVALAFDLSLVSKFAFCF